jgi:putative acetyltransferase
MIGPDMKILPVNPASPAAQALEAHLSAARVPLARLATGAKQSHAIGLYLGMGLRVRGRYGPYGHDPMSVFMEKNLTALV